LIERGADEATVRDAREAQNDGLEELQRVDAEVEAFFDDRMKKGGT
jgi:hypothetical protein